MNLRQTQRALADVITKCQDAHIQLPVAVFEGMLSAGEALRHSRVGGKLHVDDAVDELKQRYGLEPKWQQLEEATEAKRRQKRRRLRRGDEVEQAKSNTKKPPSETTTSGKPAHTSDTESADEHLPSSPDFEKRATEKERPAPAGETKKRDHGSSRIERIIENNPAKNPANEELAEEFVELGGYELTHGETQKGISRMAVAKQLREAEEPITSGAQARSLPHVGPSAAAKVDEVLGRGKMKALEQYEEEKAKGSPDQKAIHGSNSKKAQQAADSDSDDPMVDAGKEEEHDGSGVSDEEEDEEDAEEEEEDVHHKGDDEEWQEEDDADDDDDDDD